MLLDCVRSRTLTCYIPRTQGTLQVKNSLIMCGAQGKKIVIYPWFSSIRFNFVLYFSIISFSKH